ncbi:unnamed protein product [Discula destructiva]
MASTKRKLTAVAATTSIFLCLYQFWNFNSPLLRAPAPTKSSHTTFPRKIWYKLGPKGLSDEARAWTDTCITSNPQYEATFLTDETADAWVQQTYAHRPDIVETYLAIQIQMLKADWLRYMLLYVEGGMWSDLDASCNETPIDDWVPAQFKSSASLVVGWEFDLGWGQNLFHQIAAWTVLAKPGLAYLEIAVEDVLKAVQDLAAEKNIGVADITFPMLGDIVDFSGPRRLTRSVFKGLQRALGATDEAFQEIEAGAWFLEEPMLVADVLILPGWAFAKSMLHDYDQTTGVVGPSLITHHYAGSWKNEKGGE